MIPPSSCITAEVARALAEDIGTGDQTAALIDIDQRAQATVIAREAAILCGQAWFVETFRQVDPSVLVHWKAKEGASISQGTTICIIDGTARALLTAERTALNFLQFLSGIASKTQAYVQAIQGTKAKIYDTRKTIPGLRLAQKYAVRVGGGENQRMGLYESVLIKENHILSAGGICSALEAARRHTPPGISIQIEVENLEQCDQALAAGATSILLDNMSLVDLSEAVSRSASRAILEASGGIRLSTVRSVAETGVDRISIGALTKDLRSIDFSMRLD